MKKTKPTKNTLLIQLPLFDEIHFNIEAVPELLPLEGNLVCSGNDEADRILESQILHQLNQGNTWAWCTIKVTASYRGLEASDYLGGCSYRDALDFLASDYYQDMRQNCFTLIVNQLRNFQ